MLVISGGLIAESLRIGGTIEGVTLTVKIFRIEAGVAESGQPVEWTFICFEAPDEDAERFTEALSDALAEPLGWYCDFRSADETFVVFAGRVFRYRRGDVTARREVEAYARSRGVPESQLDWPE